VLIRFSFDQGNPGIDDVALCGIVRQYLTLKLTLCRLSTTDNNKEVLRGSVVVEPHVAALAVSVAGSDATHQGVWK
jgi:hypothetical protein